MEFNVPNLNNLMGTIDSSAHFMVFLGFCLVYTI